MRNTGESLTMDGMSKLYAIVFFYAVTQGLLFGDVKPPLRTVDKYWTGETNLVAAVCGYERSAIIENGEVITIYSDTIDDMCTNYTAILFHVLSPASCRGRRFRLKGLPDEPYFLPYEYIPGRLYYFPFRPDLTNKGEERKMEIVINRDDLIPGDLGTHWKMTVATIFGERYFTNSLSARKELASIEDKHSALTNELAELRGKIACSHEDKKVKSKLKMRCVKLETYLIPRLIAKEDELKKQIYHLEQMGK